MLLSLTDHVHISKENSLCGVILLETEEREIKRSMIPGVSIVHSVVPEFRARHGMYVCVPTEISLTILKEQSTTGSLQRMIT